MDKEEAIFNIDIYPDWFTGEYPCHRDEQNIRFWAHQTGNLKIIKEKGVAAIIRESGHQYFSGIGNFPYTPPRYHVGIFGLDTGHGRDITDCFVVIYSIEYSRKAAKDARGLAEFLFESLIEEEK